MVAVERDAVLQEDPLVEGMTSTAKRFFIQTTEKAPGSTTAQAAGITLLCRQADLTPTHLMGALMADDAALQDIAVAAQARHKASQNPNAPLHIPLYWVREQVRFNFTFAQDLSVLSEEQLERLRTTLYREHFADREKPTSEKEDGLRLVAEQMIAAQLAALRN